jgi:hypothetical protein
MLMCGFINTMVQMRILVFNNLVTSPTEKLTGTSSYRREVLKNDLMVIIG